MDVKEVVYSIVNLYYNNNDFIHRIESPTQSIHDETQRPTISDPAHRAITSLWCANQYNETYKGDGKAKRP